MYDTSMHVAFVNSDNYIIHVEALKHLRLAGVCDILNI